MTAVTFHLRADMADGTSWEVTADQRDVAEFEVQPVIGCSIVETIRRPFTFARFLAWHAGRREGKHVLSWEQFKDACAYADTIEEDEPDPTPREASGGPSSK